MILLKKKEKIVTPEETSGESIELDTSNKDLKELDVDGKSEQYTTTGKNKFNLYYQHNSGDSVTSAGITYTFNNDGSLTLNGTTSGTSYVMIYGANLNDYSNAKFTVPYPYKVSGIPSGILINGRKTDGSYVTIYDGGGEKLTEETELGCVYIQAQGTQNNVKIYLMLESGSTVTSWEPYTNGASPNPDYPQEIDNITGDLEITDGTNSVHINLGTTELCKIGDVKDTLSINMSNGVVTKNKNIGKTIFDGTETIINDSSFISSGRFSIPVTNATAGNTTNNGGAISTHFIGRYANDNGSVYLSSAGLQINLINQNYRNDLSGFRTWLSNNTPTVYYQLATPTTEVVTTLTASQIDVLKSIFEDGVINLNTNLNSSMTLKYDTTTFNTVFEFDKILRNGYRIKEDNDKIIQKFINGHRKEILNDYTDCIISLDLGTDDLETTYNYLQELTTSYYEYYSFQDNKIKIAKFIIQERPELQVESAIDNNATIDDFTVTLLKAGD